MELEIAKFYAAAIALLPLIAVAIGLGWTFSSYFQAISRNPKANDLLETKYWLSFAFIEAIGIFALLIVIMILFVL